MEQENKINTTKTISNTRKWLGNEKKLKKYLFKHVPDICGSGLETFCALQSVRNIDFLTNGENNKGILGWRSSYTNLSYFQRLPHTRFLVKYV